MRKRKRPGAPALKVIATAAGFPSVCRNRACRRSGRCEFRDPSCLDQDEAAFKMVLHPFCAVTWISRREAGEAAADRANLGVQILGCARKAGLLRLPQEGGTREEIEDLMKAIGATLDDPDLPGWFRAIPARNSSTSSGPECNHA